MLKYLLLILPFLFPLSIRAYPTHSPVTPQVAYEVRAVWLTTLMGLDWPQRPATTPAQAEEQKKQLCQMLDQLQLAGINTVLFQARIRSTTAYLSCLEPWDGVFTGSPGQRPPYDPLQYAVEQCHQRGMECHAWVVCFPICKVSVAKQLGSKALPSLHPELCQRCGDQWMMDPGVPATANYLAQVCQEIVQNYEVDGLHLDYIRYPEPSVPFNDEATYRRYGKGQNKQRWRTNNINACVQTIAEAVKQVHPWVKLSCSPVGKYSDLSRYSSRGWNARDAVSQDAQLWLRKGWMDMLFPMMYFDGDNYYPFLADWREHDANRPVVPGLGAYCLDAKEKDWALGTIQRQMNVARSVGMGGLAFFRTRFLLNNTKGLLRWLQTDFYSRKALVPPMTWLNVPAPSAPKVTQSFVGNKLCLSWQPVAADVGRMRYNVYRLDSLHGDDLLAVRIADTHFEKLLALPALRHSRYVVTAVNAYGVESEAGEP